MARGDVPVRLRTVPQFILDGLRTQVDGDWSRVTVDEHGGVTVHNHPQVDDGPRRRRPATKTGTKTARPARPRPPTPAVLAGRVENSAPERQSVQQSRGGTFKPPPEPAPIETPAPQFRPTVVPTPQPAWIRIPGVNQEGDWERIGIAGTSHQLSRQLRNGLPEQVPVKVNIEVLAMDGVDIAATKAVLRHPEQVKISEETAEKKYPVLTFHRGDVTVVLGFRNPHEPFIMAAYFTGEALKEYQRSRGAAGGGGGARKSEGVPTNPRALRRRLAEMGASITADHDPDPEKDGKTATVIFRGEVLGRIRLDRPSRFEVSQDWQRMQRKIHAITRREDSRKSG